MHYARHRLALALLLAAGAVAWRPTAGQAQQSQDSSARGSSGLIYDQDYPFIGYSGVPRHNEIARLAARIASGEVKLQYREPRGYLDSLLAALHIDPNSQTLVFSQTSLQAEIISSRTPRAIYFDDDTYVAWIPHTSIIEISTMDGVMGTVFYTLSELPADRPTFDRETTRCLSCHDTFSLSGGGVPNFLFLSAYTRRAHEILTNDSAIVTTDATPLADRWGGWYVTGNLGDLPQLGDVLPSASGAIPVSSLHPRNLANLDGLFDTRPYLTNTSDAVALLVLEHQVSVHNLIIHANYKCRVLLERQSPGPSRSEVSWEQLPSETQRRFVTILEPLVRGMLFADAARFPAPIRGGSSFAKSFAARGPRDRKGRSLRDFDLHTRLFKYPLSFLIYSEGFDDLPVAAKQYVYERLDQILSARDAGQSFPNISPQDGRAILEILRATKPDFARAQTRLH